MVHRVQLSKKLGICPKNFLMMADNAQQVIRILDSYIGLDIPYKIVGTITRLGPQWSKYEVLNIPLLVMTKPDVWIITIQPTSYELGLHHTFITRERRDHEKINIRRST